MNRKILLTVSALLLMIGLGGIAIQKGQAAVPDDTAPRIELADAKKDFDENTAVFIDTRSPDIYKEEHIKGAINIQASDFDAKFKDIPKDKKIIAYCSWPAEHTSAGLVQKLMQIGIGNAYALKGGTQAWKNAGYPMEGEKK